MPAAAGAAASGSSAAAAAPAGAATLASPASPASFASPASATSPFDELAAGYDEAFTHGAVGTLLRRPLQRRLLALFARGDSVLELGCGTGEDAVFLGRHGVRVLATDASPGMVAAARRKVDAAGLQDLVEVRRLALEELPLLGGREASEGPPFDGAFSSFGGFNCAGDPRGPARDLGALLRPGARLLLCVMGPLVPWEWGWFLLRGRPAKAFRRLRPGGARWRGMTIRYPAIGAMKRAFGPDFRARRVAALGVLLPPSYAEPWAARHPRLLARLDSWERRWETVPPLPWLADHYVLELERR
ncbi:MAG: class I SAM-dependent methyltransferase [Acidobacteria bacterium]|nr:class I SAM-dependent methyltransferase [Acidobacteriota bacterium]